MNADNIDHGTSVLYDYWWVAKHAAEHESPTEGLLRLFECLEGLYELAYPLMWVRAQNLNQPLTLSLSAAKELGETLTAFGNMHVRYAHHRASLRDADLAPLGWDVMSRSHYEWCAHHALRCWQAAEDLLRQPHLADMRERYERAISIGLEHVERFGSFDALITYYFDDRACSGVSNRGASFRLIWPGSAKGSEHRNWMSDLTAQTPGARPGAETADRDPAGTSPAARCRRAR